METMRAFGITHYFTDEDTFSIYASCGFEKRHIYSRSFNIDYYNENNDNNNDNNNFTIQSELLNNQQQQQQLQQKKLKYSFVLIDAAPDPGTDLSFSIFGGFNRWKTKSYQKASQYEQLQSELSKPDILDSDHVFLVSHYTSPSLNMDTRHNIQKILKQGKFNENDELHRRNIWGFLTGHIHNERMDSTRNQRRYVEAQVAAMLESQLFRIYVIDNDMVSFIDCKYELGRLKPGIIDTVQLDQENNQRKQTRNQVEQIDNLNLNLNYTSSSMNNNDNNINKKTYSCPQNLTNQQQLPPIIYGAITNPPNVMQITQRVPHYLVKNSTHIRALIFSQSPIINCWVDILAGVDDQTKYKVGGTSTYKVEQQQKEEQVNLNFTKNNMNMDNITFQEYNQTQIQLQKSKQKQKNQYMLQIHKSKYQKIEKYENRLLTSINLTLSNQQSNINEKQMPLFVGEWNPLQFSYDYLKEQEKNQMMNLNIANNDLMKFNGELQKVNTMILHVVVSNNINNIENEISNKSVNDINSSSISTFSLPNTYHNHQKQQQQQHSEFILSHHPFSVDSYTQLPSPSGGLWLLNYPSTEYFLYHLLYMGAVVIIVLLPLSQSVPYFAQLLVKYENRWKFEQSSNYENENTYENSNDNNEKNNKKNINKIKKKQLKKQKKQQEKNEQKNSQFNWEDIIAAVVSNQYLDPDLFNDDQETDENLDENINENKEKLKFNEKLKGNNNRNDQKQKNTDKQEEQDNKKLKKIEKKKLKEQKKEELKDIKQQKKNEKQQKKNKNKKYINSNEELNKKEITNYLSNNITGNNNNLVRNYNKINEVQNRLSIFQLIFAYLNIDYLIPSLLALILPYKIMRKMDKLTYQCEMVRKRNCIKDIISEKLYGKQLEEDKLLENVQDLRNGLQQQEENNTNEFKQNNLLNQFSLLNETESEEKEQENNLEYSNQEDLFQLSYENNNSKLYTNSSIRKDCQIINSSPTFQTSTLNYVSQQNSPFQQSQSINYQSINSPFQNSQSINSTSQSQSLSSISSLQISQLSHLSLWHPSYKVRLIQFLIRQLYPYFHIGLFGCIYLSVITLWITIGPIFIGFGGLKKELVFVFSWGVSYGNRMYAREGMYTTYCLEAVYYVGILLTSILAHTDRLKLISKQEKKKKIKVVKNKNQKQNDQNISNEKHSVQSPFFFSQKKTIKFSSYLPRVRDTRCALDKLSIIVMFYFYYKGYFRAV